MIDNISLLEEGVNKDVKLILITGVSGSGKSTLKDALMESSDRFAQPIQYTTRKCRSDAELDSYVFLTKDTFFRKLNNGDFCENATYLGQSYGIGRFFTEGKISIAIVETVGREAMKKFCLLNNIPFLSVYIHIPEDIMEYRLGMLRRSSVNEIAERKKDYLHFNDYGSDIILDGAQTVENNVNIVNNYINNLGFEKLV